ncbi:TRAP transporter small permease [Parendozoicomonas haliclonae]|uniref:TRAP transporter small permease protein n=1 Tax=Parendozoicomonas haliclonae TaxID=1960125 RepID=A0A1X7ANG4_9GAMM|nr:TRAP transporter small permease [Parendozoicomonas haliclonae]SMA48408.1 2,3-diketo-L-gulonate TRAP transporter small permease protein YiaM [Parendozoicomonas haliclonae]
MLSRLLHSLHWLEEAILRLLLVAITLLVFTETVLRFGFDTGLLWAQEATLYMAAWFVLFGASWGIRSGAHIGVDAFVKLLPDFPRRIAGIIAVLMGLVYSGLFVYGGWIYVSKIKMIGIEMEDLPFPKWIALSILVIGFSLLAVRLLVLLKQLITGEADGFNHADEAKESMKLADEINEEIGMNNGGAR